MKTKFQDPVDFVFVLLFYDGGEVCSVSENTCFKIAVLRYIEELGFLKRRFVFRNARFV